MACSHIRAAAALTGLLALAAGCKSTKPADDLNSIPDRPNDAAPTDLRSRTLANGSTWRQAGEAGDAAAATPVTASATGQRTHTVKKGDTIYSLARLYYNGDVHKWRAIYEANTAKLSDPNTLKVGQVLVIPD